MNRTATNTAVAVVKRKGKLLMDKKYPYYLKNVVHRIIFPIIREL